MKRIFLLQALIILIAGIRVSAQKKSPGYVVTLKRDTVRGFIVEAFDRNLTTRITFYREIKDSPFIYSTTDLIGFGFDYGRKFERKTFLIPNSTDSTVFFAKKILDGKIKLYTRENPSAGSSEPEIVLENQDSKRKAWISEPMKKIVRDEKGDLRDPVNNRYIGLINYVKGDLSEQTGKIPNYNEKRIVNDIVKYNEQFTKEYPTAAYIRQIKYSNDITVGRPIIDAPEGASFRVAYYRNRSFPEKSGTFSYLWGISYRYYKDENSTEQVASVIPFGINVHTNSGIIRPYVYVGVGMVFLFDTEAPTFGFIPTANIGAGVKIKVGSQFIITEITPTTFGYGTFLNIGFSF